MKRNIEFGDTPLERIVAVNGLIREGKITFSGDKRTLIYGQLTCASGKRTKLENRVFFENEDEALNEVYKPFSHCLNEKYRK
ncbi:Ada metal-binding domain-containing protein [Sphingobacterium faecium]|uniref:Ada metal-binding domain-containing protein n=1 Tax=Sphingobacterium faecium TaxID=34087 RepID=UPI003DA5C75D